MKCVLVCLVSVLVVCSPTEARTHTGDTLQVVSSDTVATDTTETTIPQLQTTDMPEIKKLEIEEDRFFDVGAIPPFTGWREDSVASVGVFPKAQSSFLYDTKMKHSRLGFGYGMHSTLRTYAVFTTSSSVSDLLFDGRYEQSDGRIENHDYLGGAARLEVARSFGESSGMFSGGQISATLSGTHDEYRLYATASPSRKRKKTDFAAEAVLSNVFDDGGSYSIGVTAEGIILSDWMRTTEYWYGGTIAGTTAQAATRVDAAAGFLYGSASLPQAANSPMFFSASVSVVRDLSAKVRVAVGGVINSARGYQGKSQTRVFPSAEVFWYPTSGVSLNVAYVPRLSRISLQDVANRNPYIHQMNPLQPAERKHDLRVSGQVEVLDKLKAEASGSYAEVAGYPVYRQVDHGLWEADQSGSVRRTSISGRLIYTPSEKTSLTATAGWQNIKLRNPRRSVPYEPAVTAGVIVEQKVGEKALLRSEATLAGKRYASDVRAPRLPSFAVWNISCEYNLTRAITLTATCENILDEEHTVWNGYNPNPLRAMLTCGVRW